MLCGGMENTYTFTYGNGLYVAFCNAMQDNYANYIITSSGGVSWTKYDLPEGTEAIYDVIYAKNLFEVVEDFAYLEEI
jgi:hypothetical protein